MEDPMTKPMRAPDNRTYKPRPPAQKRRANEEYDKRKMGQGLKRIQLWVPPEDAPRFFAVAKARRNRSKAKAANPPPT
jgi:hypothetical protein